MVFQSVSKSLRCASQSAGRLSAHDDTRFHTAAFERLRHCECEHRVWEVLGIELQGGAGCISLELDRDLTDLKSDPHNRIKNAFRRFGGQDTNRGFEGLDLPRHARRGRLSTKLGQYQLPDTIFEGDSGHAPGVGMIAGAPRDQTAGDAENSRLPFLVVWVDRDNAGINHIEAVHSLWSSPSLMDSYGLRESSPSAAVLA